MDQQIANSMIPAWQNGTLTPVEKLQVHHEGLRHMAVSVFVMQEDRILIQRRALGKYHTPGLWANTCCTHPHWGEAPIDCAARRLNEELGITGLDLTYREQVEYRADVGGGMIEHEQVDIFTAFAGLDLSVRPNPSEVMDTDWVTRDALSARIAEQPDAFTPWLRIYIAEHSKLIFGA